MPADVDRAWDMCDVSNDLLAYCPEWRRRYPEVVEQAAVNRAPHALVHYLRELANVFHTYYNAEQFIVEEAAVRNARLALVLGVQQVVRNGLTLLGVSAPESM